MWHRIILIALILAGCNRAPVELETELPAEARPDSAILEIDLPPGSAVWIDGQAQAKRPEPADRPAIGSFRGMEFLEEEIGTAVVQFERQRFVIPGLEKGSHSMHDVEVRLPNEGGTERRQILLSAGTVTRWAPRGAQVVELQTGHSSDLHALAFTPNGQFLVTGSADGSVIIWDRKTGQQIRTLVGRAKLVNAVAVSSQGDRILSGSFDGTAILWDLHSGQPLRRFACKFDVTSVAFSPDGRTVLTGSEIGDLQVWSADQGDRLRTFSDTLTGRLAIAVCPDGRHALLGAPEDVAVLFDYRDGKIVRTLQGDGKITGAAGALAVSPNGKEALTGSYGGMVVLWDIETGKPLRTFADAPALAAIGEQPTVTALAFSPDGSRVLAGFTDKTAWLWDKASGKPLHVLRGHSHHVSAVAFAPDGKEAVTSAGETIQLAEGDDYTAWLWDLETGKKIRPFANKAKSVFAVAWSADGSQAVTGSEDAAAVQWDFRAGRPNQVFRGHKSSVLAVAFSPDGRRVLTGSGDLRGRGSEHGARLWDAATGKAVHDLPGHERNVSAVAFSPDGQLALTGSWDGTFMLSDARTGERLHRSHPPGREIFGVAFRPDGRQFLTAAIDGQVAIWHTRTREKLQAIQVPERRATAATYVPDGSQIVTAGWSAAAWHWQREEPPRVFGQAEPKGVTLHDRHWLNQVAISPDGTLLVAGCSDGTALLWEARTQKPLRTFKGHRGGVTSVAFRPDGRLVLTGSWDGTARLWDVATGDELCRLISIAGGQDWAVVTPEGLFDGSRGGRENVYFRIGGLQIVPLDRFMQDNYYPGLLAALWAGERPRPGKPLPATPAPTVKMLANPDPLRLDQVTFDVAVTDHGGGIKAPWLKHNGVTVRAGQTLLEKRGQTEQHRFTVGLVPGSNRIEVRSATADGAWESDPALWVQDFAGALPEPELHVLAVGINRQAPGAGFSDLQYCVADAHAIAELFRTRPSPLYRQVHVTMLTDEQATRAGILSAVSTLARQIRRQDTLVLFVACHGVTLGQRYFLIPHDMKTGSTREHALAIDDLAEALSEAPALKRVLIFDTCQSGGVTGLAARRNPFLAQTERFSRTQGVYCLAAATANQGAAEEKKLGHGLMTYTLLSAAQSGTQGSLGGKKAKGGQQGIDVLDWFRFAQKEVPGLYQAYVGRAQSVELSGEDQPGFPLLANLD